MAQPGENGRWYESCSKSHLLLLFSVAWEKANGEVFLVLATIGIIGNLNYGEVGMKSCQRFLRTVRRLLNRRFQATPLTSRLPLLELLETRDVPSPFPSLSPAEPYAWYLINTMRANPPKFADQLEGLYRNTLKRAQGLSASDPVWTDLRRDIDNSKQKDHFWQALALMRAQPPLGPLAWEDRLGRISDEHNSWMKTHAWAHSWWNGPNPNPYPTDDAHMPGYPSPESRATTTQSIRTCSRSQAPRPTGAPDPGPKT
jgi:hypothetical protein